MKWDINEEFTMSILCNTIIIGWCKDGRVDYSFQEEEPIRYECGMEVMWKHVCIYYKVLY